MWTTRNLLGGLAMVLMVAMLGVGTAAFAGAACCEKNKQDADKSQNDKAQADKAKSDAACDKDKAACNKDKASCDKDKKSCDKPAAEGEKKADAQTPAKQSALREFCGCQKPADKPATEKPAEGTKEPVKQSNMPGHVVMATLVSLAADTKAIAIPEKLAFTLEDQNGKKVSLSDYADKIVVLEWINEQCPYVVRHYKASTMVNLASKYQSKGVVWLAINSTHNTTKESDKKWIAANNIPYPILDDRSGQVGRQYGAKTTPHMFIIQNGQLVYQGAIDDDAAGKKDNPTNYVAKALDELLAGKTVTQAETKPYGCSVKYQK